MLPTCNMQVELARTQGAGGPVLEELLVSGSGLKCQRRRDKSVSQPSIVLAAPTQLPRYRYGFLTPLLDVLAQPVEAFLEATLLEDRAHLQM